MDILLYITVFTLASIHLLRIILFAYASDIRDIRQFRHHLKRKRIATEYPLLSIVIPTHNDAAVIETAIASALNGSYPNVEVIVSDSGSRDNTRTIVRQLMKKNRRIKLRFSRMNKWISATTVLNDAISTNARGSFVMLLEPTRTLAHDAAENSIQHFKDDRRLAALVSNSKIAFATSRLERLNEQLESKVGTKLKRTVSVFNIEYNLNGPNVTFRKSYLKKVHFFYDNDDPVERILRTFDRISKFDCRIKYGDNVYTQQRATSDIRSSIARRLTYKYGRQNARFRTQPAFTYRQSARSRPLSWLRLPYAVYSDILLSIEPVFALFLLVNMTLLFEPYILLFSIVAFTFYVSFLLMISNREDLSFWQKMYVLLFAPFSWLLLYIITLLDYRTLVLYLRTMRTPTRTALYN